PRRVPGARVWLLLPHHRADTLSAALQRYVFRRELQLRPLAAVRAAIGPARSDVHDDRIAGDPDRGIALDLGGDGLPRCLLLLPEGHPALAAEDPDRTRDWLAPDIALGPPRPRPQQAAA